MRRRACGPDAVAAALDAGDVALLMLTGPDRDPAVASLEIRAQQLGIPVWRGSEGDMRRMSPDSSHPQCVIAMLGQRADVDLATALGRPGAHWLLHRVSYPSNVGFAIRTAEVSGAASITIDTTFNHAERSRVRHVSMGAERLLPVHYSDTAAVLALAREHGHRIVAVESAGSTPPWEVDLTGSVLIVVGAEREGIAQHVLDGCDAIAHIPMHGFVPSYSLQAAISMVAAERLRQLATANG